MRRKEEKSVPTGGNVQADERDPDLLQSSQDTDVGLCQFGWAGLHTQDGVNDQIVRITDQLNLVG